MSLPEGFDVYLAAQAKRRVDEAAKMYDALTEREQDLVREASIMAFVRGVMTAGGTREQILSTPAILQEVLLGCQSHSNLYPTIAALDGVVRTSKDDDD